MELSDKTARQLYEEIKANPTRKRFGFGRKPALINVDLQNAYTRVDEFKTAYETDPKQIDYVNILADLFRTKNCPVVWTHVAYMELGGGLRRLGHAHEHAGFAAEHQSGLPPLRFDDRLQDRLPSGISSSTSGWRRHSSRPI